MPAVRLNLDAYAFKSSSERRTTAIGLTELMPVEHRCRETVGELENAKEPEVVVVVVWAGGRKAGDVHYPRTAEERASFRLGNGKRVPRHHWDVYDYIFGIPEGKVTTYKEVSRVVGGSPRSVGNALRNNPFMPYIPCHRVIASDLTLGGYFGEWGKAHKTGTRYHQKLDILAREGVEFTERGKLARSEEAIWKPCVSE